MGGVIGWWEWPLLDLPPIYSPFLFLDRKMPNKFDNVRNENLKIMSFSVKDLSSVIVPLLSTVLVVCLNREAISWNVRQGHVHANGRLLVRHPGRR